jgi:hypothetical protein
MTTTPPKANGKGGNVEKQHSAIPRIPINDEILYVKEFYEKLGEESFETLLEEIIEYSRSAPPDTSEKNVVDWAVKHVLNKYKIIITKLKMNLFIKITKSWRNRYKKRKEEWDEEQAAYEENFRNFEAKADEHQMLHKSWKEGLDKKRGEKRKEQYKNMHEEPQPPQPIKKPKLPEHYDLVRKVWDLGQYFKDLRTTRSKRSLERIFSESDHVGENNGLDENKENDINALNIIAEQKDDNIEEDRLEDNVVENQTALFNRGQILEQRRRKKEVKRLISDEFRRRVAEKEAREQLRENTMMVFMEYMQQEKERSKIETELLTEQLKRLRGEERKENDPN